jgi:hypothetical protein
MVTVLGSAAMAVDVGIFLHERRDLQNAADAAALAGVQELPFSATEAEAWAAQWAENNGIGDGELGVIEVSTTYAENDTVTVGVQRDVSFVFGRVLGLTDDTMQADATARVGSPGYADNVMPWALRTSYKDAAEENEGFGVPVVLMEAAQGGASGAHGAICFGAHCGASDYRDGVKYGGGMDLEGLYEMNPGVMPGPTGQGMDYRLSNTDENCDTFEQVFTEVGEDDWAFTTNDCNPWTEAGSGSLRVVLAPVIDDYYFDECGGASCTIQGSGFAILFLEDPSACVTPEHPDEPLVCARFLRAAFDLPSLIGAYNPDSDVRLMRLVE